MPRTKKGRYNLESTSSDDSDVEQTNRQQSARVTNKPLRLGIFETETKSSFVSSCDSQDDLFGSNESLELYLPPAKRKNINQNFSEKQPIRINQKRSEESLSSIASQKSNEPSGSRDFNSQFDMLRLRMKPSTSYPPRENTENACIASDMLSNDKTIGRKNSNKKNASAGISVQPADVQPVFVGHYNEPDELNAVDAVNFGKQISAKLNEILARIATLEKMMITSATNSGGNGLKKVTDQLNSEAQLFMKSNSLPTKNRNELQKLDTNLRDPAFYTATVSV